MAESRRKTGHREQQVLISFVPTSPQVDLAPPSSIGAEMPEHQAQRRDTPSMLMMVGAVDA